MRVVAHRLLRPQALHFLQLFKHFFIILGLLPFLQEIVAALAFILDAVAASESANLEVDPTKFDHIAYIQNMSGQLWRYAELCQLVVLCVGIISQYLPKGGAELHIVVSIYLREEIVWRQNWAGRLLRTPVLRAIVPYTPNKRRVVSGDDERVS